MEIIVNGRPRRLADGATVAELLGDLDLATRHLAVEVNLELVPRPAHGERRLAEGDRVEIVTLVGGG